MKLFLLIALGFIGTNLYSASEEVTTTLENELKRSAQLLQNDLVAAKRKLAQLREQQTQLTESIQKQAAMENEGIELIRSYSTLITARYVDDKGEYQPGQEISVKDQEYINRLCGKYLRTHPLSGKTSAGEGIRALNWAISRLSEFASVHAAPSEMNNSELEILANQARALEQTIAKQSAVAARLGVTIPSGDEVREPTSESSESK